MMAYQIRLKGKQQEDLILVGSLKRGGIITTPERHRDVLLGLAYLNEDGEIMRLHEQIGTRADITITGRVKAPQRRQTYADNLCGLATWLDAACGDLPADIPEIQ